MEIYNEFEVSIKTHYYLRLLAGGITDEIMTLFRKRFIWRVILRSVCADCDLFSMKVFLWRYIKAEVYDDTPRVVTYKILIYNISKAGVDTMNPILSGYFCKRLPNQGELTMFYIIFNVAVLAPFVIYNVLKPINDN